jgi:hypothetical protein
MTTTNPLQPETKPLVITNIDLHKVHKYLPRLLNGEAYKLERWLPNILSTGGIMDREKYDYRIGQFKTKDKEAYNSKLTFIIQKIERMKQSQANAQKQLDLDRQELVLAFNRLKVATDLHHEKNSTQLY